MSPEITVREAAEDFWYAIRRQGVNPDEALEYAKDFLYDLYDQEVNDDPEGDDSDES